MKSIFRKCAVAALTIPVLWAFALAVPEVLADDPVSAARNCPSGHGGDAKMFKVLALLKRRDGMSVEAFRNYYENQHAPLALSFIPKGKICRYFRRFVNRQVDAASGEVAEPRYDSISEFWFASREDYEDTMRQLAKPEVKSVMDEDEAQLFDRSNMIILEIEEYESAISPIPFESK